MPATILNCIFILFGSVLGILLRNRISERLTGILTQALGLCVLAIGISSAVATKNILCVVVCMVAGSLLGELLRLEDRLDQLGDQLKTKLMQGKGDRFTEGFVTASVLYCVGAMAVMGAIEAGIHQNYSILISKGVIDGVTAISFAAAMGVGVAFSAVPVFLYQGGLTLLAAKLSAYLDLVVVTEMSAVGGVIIMGIAINLLGMGSKRLKVGNMLPSIFLPLLYLPAAQIISEKICLIF